jgi:hypothetical protein
MRKALGTYMHWKYECDKELIKRTAFKWTILRPGGLTLDPGAGTASIGRTHLTPGISVRTIVSYNRLLTTILFGKRDDVAKVLQLLVDRPKAAGLVIDLIGGSEPLEDALDAVIQRDFAG